MHGHDAFLIEFEQMQQLLKGVFDTHGKSERIKILKFGGKSLSNGEGLERVLDIISAKVKNGENIAVVLSAREKATDQLEAILDKASKGLDYRKDFEDFERYQKHTFKNISLSEEFLELVKLFEGVTLLGDYSPKIKDQVLAYGELISGELITKLLIGKGISAKLLDTRRLIKTDDSYGDAKLLEDVSRENVIHEFSKLKLDEVADLLN